MLNYYDYDTPEPRHYLVGLSSKNIRYMARQTLRGHWLEAVAAAFIIEAIVSGPRMLLGAIGGNSEFVTFLSDLYSIVITGPAVFGLTSFLIGIFRMQDPSRRTIYSGMNNRQMFLKSMLLYCTMMVRIFLWSLLFVIPGVIASIKYSMAFKVQADHPDYSSLDCLYESARIMNGNKLKYLFFRFSFWLWAVLVSVPQAISFEKAMEGIPSLEVLFNDLNAAMTFVDAYSSNPLTLVSSVLGVVLGVYVQTSECCFYDLAAGNLIIRNSETGDDSYGD